MIGQSTTIRVLLMTIPLSGRIGNHLNRDPEMTVIATAENGQQAIDCFREYQPDVTLMDGECRARLEAISAICAEFKPARIIVLTTYDGDEDIYRGLHSGAQGYLLDAKPNELLNAIRTVHRGQQYIPPDVEQNWCSALAIQNQVNES